MLESMRKKSYPQQDLAELIAEAMDESGVSQADVARHCGITIQSVNQWRRTGRISKQHLVTLARLTGKPLEYFLLGLGRAAIFVMAVCVVALVQPNRAYAHDSTAFFSRSLGPSVYYVKLRRVVLLALQALHTFLQFSDGWITASQ